MQQMEQDIFRFLYYEKTFCEVSVGIWKLFINKVLVLRIEWTFSVIYHS